MDPETSRDMFLKDSLLTLDIWENWLRELTGYIEGVADLQEATEIMTDFRNAVHNNVTGFITLTADLESYKKQPDLG